MDIARQNAWRSETKDPLDCPGQLAIGFPGGGPYDSRAGSGPIPGIVFPTQTKVINNDLLASATETNRGTDKQDAFPRLSDGPKAGPLSAADWIAEIKRIWARGPASTLELARAVAAAKSPLRHGQWQEIWQGLPFSRRKADMLAAIGRRLAWVKWQTFADLPAGWSILYELSKLKRAAFEEFVRKGAIHPALKLWEAKQLIAQFRGAPLKTRPARAVLRERLRRFVEYFAAHLAELSAEDIDLAEAQLTRIIEQIGARKLLALAPRAPAF